VESKLGPLDTSAAEWPIVPAPADYDDGVFGGMKTGLLLIIIVFQILKFLKSGRVLLLVASKNQYRKKCSL
jgi:hypothetical protein